MCVCVYKVLAVGVGDVVTLAGSSFCVSPRPTKITAHYTSGAMSDTREISCSSFFFFLVKQFDK